VLFLNIVLRHNILFAYRSKVVLITLGFILSVFRGRVEHLQVSECPGAVWSAIGEDQLA
jgi:hypothetical protein